MEELESIIAENLTYLRKSHRLTQQELAEKIDYSDKSISKWELGKATPSVDVLNKFAKFYEVSLDFIVSKHSHLKASAYSKKSNDKTNKIVIIAMIATFILFAAVAIYVNSLIIGKSANMWVVFIWVIPASSFLCSLFYLKFFGKRLTFWLLFSIFIWSALVSVALTYLLFMSQNVFFIMLVGIPLQISVILLAQLK